MDDDILFEKAWNLARKEHQATWAELSVLYQLSLKDAGIRIIAGETATEGDDNIARFERAVSSLLSEPEPPSEVQAVAEAVIEEAPPQVMAMAAPIPEEEPKGESEKPAKKKATKKAITKKAAKKVPTKVTKKASKK